MGVVLDLNDGENNDKSPTTWEVALESKMKTVRAALGGWAAGATGGGPCHEGAYEYT